MNPEGWRECRTCGVVNAPRADRCLICGEWLRLRLIRGAA